MAPPEEESDKYLSLEIQSFICQQQTKILHATETKQVVEGLQDVLDRFSLGSKATQSDQVYNKEEFFKRYFVRFTKFLLQPLILDWYGKLSSKERIQCFDVLFNEGPVEETFVALDGSVARLANPRHIAIVASLMSEFVKCNRLVDLFLEQTQGTSVKQEPVGIVANEQLIRCLISLPDRLANKLKLDGSFSQLHPENYFRALASQIALTLEEVHDSLSTTKDCSFQFISELIGRVSLLGQGAHIFSVLLPSFEKWINTTPLWSRICSRVVTRIPDSGLESAMEQLLKGIHDPVLVSKMLGDKILSHSRLKYLLTTKFILFRYYSQISVPYNIVSYLAGCQHRHLLVETLMTILDVWGDQTAVKHTPYDQHAYITRVIILCFAHLNKEEKQIHKHKLLTKLLNGMQSHLESPIEKVRHLGMVTAECITLGLDPNGRTPLKFDYKESEETDLLFALAKKPSAGRLKELKQRFGVFLGIETDAVSKPRNGTQKSKSGIASKSDTTSPGKIEKEVGDDKCVSSDDDDDLKPYDLAEDDASSESAKSPRYLRDCIEGLLESDNPEKTEASLKAVEKLVCAQPDDLEELAVELVKILIHTEDRYSTENFAKIRHSAMVAIATRCPRQIAGYLTEEVFAANYNLQQRIDMLDVLTSSAQQLAVPVELLKERPRPSKFQISKPKAIMSEDKAPNWQAIVQERIESKTRRFGRGSAPVPQAVANKFADVAGNFFYPLLRNFDVKLNTLDLLGKDSFVLARLIQTLSTVMYCARDTVAARAMGATLTEFLWALRYHNEPYVRQALIFSVAMVIVSVSSSLLMADAGSELFDIHDWLKDIVQSDSDTDCRKTALQTLLLFDGVLQSEVSGQT